MVLGKMRNERQQNKRDEGVGEGYKREPFVKNGAGVVLTASENWP